MRRPAAAALVLHLHPQLCSLLPEQTHIVLPLAHPILRLSLGDRVSHADKRARRILLLRLQRSRRKDKDNSGNNRDRDRIHPATLVATHLPSEPVLMILQGSKRLI